MRCADQGPTETSAPDAALLATLSTGYKSSQAHRRRPRSCTLVPVNTCASRSLKRSALLSFSPTHTTEDSLGVSELFNDGFAQHPQARS